MNTYAAIAVAGIATVYALIGLLGRPPAGAARGTWSSYTSALPIMTVGAAATLAVGFSMTSALIAAVSVAAAVVLGGLSSKRGWPDMRAGAPGSSAVASLASLVVTVGLTVLLVDFAAGLIADLTALRFWVVVVVLVVGGVAAGFGRGGQVGQARVALVVIAILAVVLLILGLVLGSASYLGTEMIPAETPGWQENVAFPVALIVAALAHPGLGPGVAGSARGPVAAAIACGISLLLGMAGLLMIAGGLIQVPSVQLNALVAFAPPAANILIAVFAGGLALTVIARTTVLATEGLESMGSKLGWGDSRAGQRKVFLAIVAGIAMVLLGWAGPPPVATVFVLAAVSVVGLACRWWSARHSAGPVRGPESQDDLAPVG